MSKLNSLAIQKSLKPGLFADGNGLYLQVSQSGAKSWIFRYMINRKARAMGLGSLDLVTVAEARVKALESRKLLLDGKDPIEARVRDREQVLFESKKSMTFDQCAAAYIAAHRAGWKNQKHANQWVNTIQQYASPVFGRLPASAIDTGLVMEALEPIWYEKSETASRLRNRIELVLAWATVRGYRKGENPARWKGHLDHLLPKRSDIAKVKHFSALPFDQVSRFIGELRKLKGIVPRALEFQILTATRPGETTGTKWLEIDLEQMLWTIPASRMKAGREHQVPLSPRACEILHEMRPHATGELVFPGRTKSRSLSNNAFLVLIKKRMGRSVTAHGFRSTFRDWSSEKTGFSSEVIEMALAHAIRNATEAAYRRGNLLLKRRVLMNEWATYCDRVEDRGLLLGLSSKVLAQRV